MSFFWVLSLLSGRTLDQVVQESFDRLTEVLESADNSADDEFSRGLAVIQNLVYHLIAADRTGAAVDGAELAALVDSLDALPPEPREEIGRHLDMILTGALQDEIDEREDARVRAARESGDRRTRAVKFFVPDPEPPLRPEPAPVELGGRERVVLGLAAPLAALGVVGLLGSAIEGRFITATLSLMLFLGGAACFAAGWFDREAAQESRRRQIERHEHEGGVVKDPWRPLEPNPAVARFTYRVGLAFDAWFDAHRPEDPTGGEKPASWRQHPGDDLSDAERWDAVTRPLRVTLANETVLRYGSERLPTADGLQWLAHYHAREAAERWKAGTYFGYRRPPQLPRRSLLLLRGGGAAAVLALPFFVATVVAAAPLRAIGSLLLLGAAGYLAWGAGREALITWRRRPHEDAAAEVLHRRLVDFHDWNVTYLTDRPTDQEMATWFELDLRHIRSRTLKQYGLRHRDLIGHLVLSERVHGSLRARVPGGPPRYSDYRVEQYLLTENGVRRISWELDFLDGSLGDQKRLSFRYDTLASATVHEVGVRYDGARRRVALLSELDAARATGADDAGDDGAGAGRSDLSFRRSFRLTLVNGQHSDVLIEDFEDWRGELGDEDHALLVQRAMDSAGVTTAMRILEAIAAEGREWIQQERTKYLRTLEKRMQTRARGLTGPPDRRALLRDDDPPGGGREPDTPAG